MNPEQHGKNIPYYLAAAGIFILLKLFFRFADNDTLRFLLAPTNRLVELFTGSCATYSGTSGYLHETLNIVIGKSCAGFNFLALAFVLFAYLGIAYSATPARKIRALAGAPVGAYVLTVLVNAARIVAALVVQSRTDRLFPEYHGLVHETVGIVTNLTFLILAYLLLEKRLKGNRTHEKSA